MRIILYIHRYLAVAIGLLMTLWCLSGFVMMYQSFPSLSEEQRLAGLEPLNFTLCCNTSRLDADNDARAPGFRIEMLLGDPVLRLNGGFRDASREGSSFSALNLRTGLPLAELSPADVIKVARQYGQANGIEGEARSLGVIDIDQWTIQTARRNQPAWHIAFDDPAATEIYISGASGEVFQMTDRRLRILGWLGAIPHWLYPTMLRQNGALWTEIVIWTSVAGTFLAATGLYVGISRLRRRPRDGRLASPFRGWWYWHHISGLLFGVLALTWVFSGLMTMNPWGALSGGGGGAYRNSIIGSATWGEIRTFLEAAESLDQTKQLKQLQSAPFNNRLYVMARQADATEIRLDAAARLAQLTDEQVKTAVANLPARVQELQLMEQEDSYYYGHKSEAELPVYRIILDDAEQTRIYLHPKTGNVRSVGASGRMSRWIRTGLHGMDFPLLRIRPVWDVVVILLLAGVTLLCAIGSWLAIKRVRMDFLLLRNRLRKRFAGQGAAGFAWKKPDSH
jgi:hypothetical protein